MLVTPGSERVNGSADRPFQTANGQFSLPNKIKRFFKHRQKIQYYR